MIFKKDIIEGIRSIDKDMTVLAARIYDLEKKVESLEKKKTAKALKAEQPKRRPGRPRKQK